MTRDLGNFVLRVSVRAPIYEAHGQPLHEFEGDGLPPDKVTVDTAYGWKTLHLKGLARSMSECRQGIATGIYQFFDTTEKFGSLVTRATTVEAELTLTWDTESASINQHQIVVRPVTVRLPEDVTPVLQMRGEEGRIPSSIFLEGNENHLKTRQLIEDARNGSRGVFTADCGVYRLRTQYGHLLREYCEYVLELEA